MSQHSTEFRRILEECDVAGARTLWAQERPGLSQPKNDHDTLVTLHIARTAAESMPLKPRAYSHRWLVERGYPSSLPDKLKPEAERVYPRVVEAVGIASLTRKPHTLIVRGAMQDAVMECYEDKRTEPAFVKSRMREARAYMLKKLFG